MQTNLLENKNNIGLNKERVNSNSPENIKVLENCIKILEQNKIEYKLFTGSADVTVSIGEFKRLASNLIQLTLHKNQIYVIINKNHISEVKYKATGTINGHDKVEVNGKTFAEFIKNNLKAITSFKPIKQVKVKEVKQPENKKVKLNNKQKKTVERILNKVK